MLNSQTSDILQPLRIIINFEIAIFFYNFYAPWILPTTRYMRQNIVYPNNSCHFVIQYNNHMHSSDVGGRRRRSNTLNVRFCPVYSDMHTWFFNSGNDRFSPFSCSKGLDNSIAHRIYSKVTTTRYRASIPTSGALMIW